MDSSVVNLNGDAQHDDGESERVSEQDADLLTENDECMGNI